MEIVLATINAKWIHPSLALRLLKANLGSLEHKCTILEFALRQPLEEKTQAILSFNPRILGFSVSIWNHLATLELLKTLNVIWEQKPVVILGGPEVSWLPESAEIFMFADYVIRGEGEESFYTLCSEILCKTPLPFAAKTAVNTAVFINRGSTTAPIDKIKTAYHLYSDEDLQKKLIYAEASRGCPFTCEFCQAPGKLREFPLEPFFAEMETLIKRGVGTIKFLDRTFNANISRAKKIMEFFLERIKVLGIENKNGRPFTVHFEMVPSRFPGEIKEFLCRFPAGTLRLEIGIQTFNCKTAALIQLSRNQTEIDEIIENLKFLRLKTSAILHVDLIAGLPGENLTSFAAGFDLLWQNLSGGGPEQRFEIQLGILKNLPGTPIARHNEAYGMRYSDKPPYEVIETAALSFAELEKIKNFARFWETIVNRNNFTDFVENYLPPGKPVFDKFMTLSQTLLKKFGKNWGLDRQELKVFLETQFY